MRYIFLFLFFSSCQFLASPTGLAVQQEIAEEVVEYIIEEIQERGETNDTNS